MKFKVNLTDEDGALIDQYIVGTYTEDEVDDLFEIGGAREHEVETVDFWFQVDANHTDDMCDLGNTIGEKIRSMVEVEERMNKLMEINKNGL